MIDQKLFLCGLIRFRCMSIVDCENSRFKIHTTFRPKIPKEKGNREKFVI